MKMNKRFTWKFISIFRVWFQGFLAIEVAIHLKDLISGHFFWKVCLGAFVPVIIRWATPQDQFPNEKLK
jgi:hypothetical protein